MSAKCTLILLKIGLPIAVIGCICNFILLIMKLVDLILNQQ